MEVGVGSRPEVALILNDVLDVIVTDVKEQEYAGVRFYRDDLFNPDMRIYRNASLIYSIRPPVELQAAMAGIAREAGADLLIRPFGNENADLRRYFKNYKLVNYKTSRFYLYKNVQQKSHKSL